MSVDIINWGNMPKVPGPQFPALLRQLAKGQEAIREERIANNASDMNVYVAFDHLRFGVTHLLKIDFPDSGKKPC